MAATSDGARGPMSLGVVGPGSRSHTPMLNINIVKLFQTHKWKVSLNLGDQLLFLDFVACLRFLSARWGPIR